MSAPTAAVAVETLPDDALRLLADANAEGAVSLPRVCEFFGYSRQAGRPKADAYLERVEPLFRLAESGKPFDVAKMQKALRPERGPDGEWLEIPCWKVGRERRCRAAVIVQMLYPWWRP